MISTWLIVAFIIVVGSLLYWGERTVPGGILFTKGPKDEKSYSNWRVVMKRDKESYARVNWKVYSPNFKYLIPYINGYEHGSGMDQDEAVKDAFEQAESSAKMSIDNYYESKRILAKNREIERARKRARKINSPDSPYYRVVTIQREKE